MKMIKKEYMIRFVTPAFLGDAEQKGAWRTPPFKALLRQWWRVLAAGHHAYDHEKVREEEGQLFGHAWLKADHSRTWAIKSRVLLRLAQWKGGTLGSWVYTDPKVNHPEAKRNVGAHLYLGYGPLTYLHGTNLKMKRAIRDGDLAMLQLGFPHKFGGSLRETLQLIHWFGTLGGRSRNGWGSFVLEGDGIVGYEALTQNNQLLKKISRPFSDCYEREWPHAVGKDDQGLLIWRTKSYKSWSEVMETLAKIKIDFRTVGLPFNRNQDAKAPRIDERHIVAYPVTHHGVEGWCETDKRAKLVIDRRGNLKQKERLANQIRFKVAHEGEKYFGIIYHLPCKIPSELSKKLSRDDRTWITAKERNIWLKVHQQLDNNPLISRI